jgi:hypothetical protein
MEVEAESVAFVAFNVLGIDAGAWTFGYVTTWSGGGDEAIAATKTAGPRIQRAAEHILSELNIVDNGAAEWCGRPVSTRSSRSFASRVAC